MEQGIYYKRGAKSDFASVDMLPNGKDIPRIIITDIEFHDELSINGRKDKEVWTAKFENNPWCNKPWVLNSTNRTRIAKATWHQRVEDGTECEGRINLLHNIPVRLTKEEARDVQNGGTTYGLRVSRIAAAPQAEMDKWMMDNGYAAAPKPARKVMTLAQVDAAVKWAKDNGKGIEDIKAIYEVPQDVEDALVAMFAPPQSVVIEGGDVIEDDLPL